MSASAFAASAQEEFGKQVSGNTIGVVNKEGFNGAEYIEKNLHINKVNRKKRCQFAKEHADKHGSWWSYVICR